MSKIKVVYSKKLPIPGNRYANETYEAEMEIEIFNLEPGPQFATAFADVRTAVEAEFSERRSELMLETQEKKEEKNRPAWMNGEGPDPEESSWVSQYGSKYQDVPDELEPPTVKQIAFIENLMHDKIIPGKDPKALEFFDMLDKGFMDKISAKKCIDYLLTFRWKPEHKQRGYDMKTGKKK